MYFLHWIYYSLKYKVFVPCTFSYNTTKYKNVINNNYNVHVSASSCTSPRSFMKIGVPPPLITTSQSEHIIVVRLCKPRLTQVFLKYEWLSHSESCPPIGWALPGFQHSNQLRRGEPALGLEVAAWPDNGVPTPAWKQKTTVKPYAYEYWYEKLIANNNISTETSENR